MNRIMYLLRRVWCLIVGHYGEMTNAPGYAFTRCTNCGTAIEVVRRPPP